MYTAESETAYLNIHESSKKRKWMYYLLKGSMRTIILFLLILPGSYSLQAQTAMLKKFPKVAVGISLTDSVFASFEDIDVTIILTNKEKKDQAILFDKPDKKIYPWGVSISLEDEKRKSFVKFASPEMVSTQLYTEKDAKKSGYYSLIKANDSLKSIYALYAMAIYESSDNKFPDGKYKLQLTYYGNVSNQISFELKK